jgi:hypothetical protein
MVTYGEFIATPYADGIADGVDALLHMSRYELGLVKPSLIAKLATGDCRYFCVWGLVDTHAGCRPARRRSRR